MFESNQAFTDLADNVVASWGTVFYSHNQFAADLEKLYRIWLAEYLPASWPPHRCEAFIAGQADQAAGELGSRFDNLIDTITERHVVAYGVLIDPEDHAEQLETARRHAFDHYRKYAYVHLLAEIEQECADNPGRGEESMTSCGRTGRRRRYGH